MCQTESCFEKATALSSACVGKFVNKTRSFTHRESAEILNKGRKIETRRKAVYSS